MSSVVGSVRVVSPYGLSTLTSHPVGDPVRSRDAREDRTGSRVSDGYGECRETTEAVTRDHRSSLHFISLFTGPFLVSFSSLAVGVRLSFGSASRLRRSERDGKGREA